MGDIIICADLLLLFLLLFAEDHSQLIHALPNHNDDDYSSFLLPILSLHAHDVIVPSEKAAMITPLFFVAAVALLLLLLSMLQLFVFLLRLGIIYVKAVIDRDAAASSTASPRANVVLVAAILMKVDVRVTNVLSTLVTASLPKQAVV